MQISTALVEDNASIIERVKAMNGTLSSDRAAFDHLHRIATGDQVEIRVPRSADESVREIARRAVANFMPLAIAVPAQLSFADGYYRMSVSEDTLLTDPPEWAVWNRSGMRSKQTTLFKTALKYGVAYLAVEGSGSVDDVRLRLLSTRNTMTYFRDPINDVTPVYALTRHDTPSPKEPNLLVYYDEEEVVYLEENRGEMTVTSRSKHGLGHCPVVRFPCYMDDEGRSVGVVEELEVPQNRINQTIFDLLLTQTFSSARVRWAAGLQGDPVTDADGNPIKDENGYYVFKPMSVDQSRLLLTDNPEAKFGTLEETPLQGFIDSADAAVKTFAVLGSIPPHSLLGSMANLSGETISAAMGQTMRHTHMLKMAWGEAIKEVMRLVRIAINEQAGDDYDDEVRWRDMSDASMAQIADALGKLATNLGVPQQALWSRIPGATDAEVMKMKLYAKDADEFADEGALDLTSSAERETVSLIGTPSVSLQEDSVSSIEGV